LATKFSKHFKKKKIKSIKYEITQLNVQLKHFFILDFNVTRVYLFLSKVCSIFFYKR